ncbi:hypothetical protein [Staphylococcus aureus]
MPTTFGGEPKMKLLPF